MGVAHCHPILFVFYSPYRLFQTFKFMCSLPEYPLKLDNIFLKGSVYLLLLLYLLFDSGNIIIPSWSFPWVQCVEIPIDTRNKICLISRWIALFIFPVSFLLHHHVSWRRIFRYNLPFNSIQAFPTISTALLCQQMLLLLCQLLDTDILGFVHRYNSYIFNFQIFNIIRTTLFNCKY